jgi:alanyl-tRNA synthetase
MIKIVAWEKLRGNLRFEFFAGTRALLDYQKKWKISKDIVSLVTDSEDKLAISVKKLQTELKKLSKQNALLNKANMEYEVQSIIEETSREKQKVFVQIFENRDLKDIRFLANQLIQKSDLWVLIGFKNEKAHLIFAHPECHDYNLNELLNQVAHLIEGKGGGRFNFVEAGGKYTKGIEEALESARVIVENSVLNL